MSRLLFVTLRCPAALDRLDHSKWHRRVGRSRTFMTSGELVEPGCQAAEVGGLSPPPNFVSSRNLSGETRPGSRLELSVAGRSARYVRRQSAEPPASVLSSVLAPDADETTLGFGDVVTLRLATSVLAGGATEGAIHATTGGHYPPPWPLTSTNTTASTTRPHQLCAPPNGQQLGREVVGVLRHRDTPPNHQRLRNQSYGSRPAYKPLTGPVRETNGVTDESAAHQRGLSAVSQPCIPTRLNRFSSHDPHSAAELGVDVGDDRDRHRTRHRSGDVEHLRHRHQAQVEQSRWLAAIGAGDGQGGEARFLHDRGWDAVLA